MGEYLKHPLALNEEEIKYAVCKGGKPSDWTTFFSKKLLQEFMKLGYGDFYGEYNGDTETIEKLIAEYDQVDTFVVYEELLQIESPLEYKDILKEYLLSENIGFVLFKDGERILVTDKRFRESIFSFCQEKHIPEQLSPYEYLPEQEK